VKDQLSQRGAAIAYSAPPQHAPNAALLIDFDNVTMGIRSDLQNQLRRLLNSELLKGKISVQRAYADWRRYPQYIVPLSEASIDLIFAPAFGSNKKNATDIRLAIDALELVFTRPEIGTFILLSGDSDFSALVLKLKEYAKYVIGVGIRESSSDLLIQNCDEYFSYSELTGLLKEGEIEHRRRDPWELVVEATTQMHRHGDVMRSDRLKQVMQELDPNFDEKDTGFNKYSKFLSEAGRRGLLRLNKMENGQYEIAIGTNANVPVETDQSRAEATAARGARRHRGERDRSRDRGGRARAGGGDGVTLAAAFDLLRDALMAIGAVGDEATDGEQVREHMLDLRNGEDDPILEPGRFQRFLRQAHDAGVVDLAKNDDGYLVRMRPPQDAAESTPDDKAASAEGSRRGRGGTRGRRRTGSGTRADGEAKVSSSERDEPVSSGDAAKPAGPSGTTEAKRGIRSRRGPRGGPAARKPAEDTPAAAAKAPDQVVADVKPSGSGRRSVRGRRGSKSAKPRPPAGAGESRDVVPRAPERREPSAVSVPVTRSQEPAPTVEPAPKGVPATAPLASQDDGGGLLKRMSAALQRAVRGLPDGDGADK